METRERNSINYYDPPQSNQQSSPTSTTTPLISSNTRRNETPDHLHLYQRNNSHGFMLQKEQPEAERPERNRNPDSDPDPSKLVSLTPSQLLPIAAPPSTTARAAATVVVRYRGCLKNHAANIGAHVLDGCGEFMPSGEDGTPEALKCAACECHRSFHRREVEGESPQISLTHNQPPPAVAVQLPPAPPSLRHHRYHHPMPPIMMAFGGAGVWPAESSSEDLNIFRSSSGQLMAQTSKKRFRTKFTQEQKDKMNDFAEKIGWKIQKQDEQEVVQFCNEVGLKKQVFKVWMHNNKQATKKKEM